MRQLVVSSRAPVDHQQIVPLEILAFHQHPVTNLIHSSAVRLLKMQLHHVLFLANWVKVINARLAKAVFHIHYAVKMEQMDFP